MDSESFHNAGDCVPVMDESSCCQVGESNSSGCFALVSFIPLRRCVRCCSLLGRRHDVQVRRQRMRNTHETSHRIGARFRGDRSTKLSAKYAPQRSQRGRRRVPELSLQDSLFQERFKPGAGDNRLFGHQVDDVPSRTTVSNADLCHFLGREVPRMVGIVKGPYEPVCDDAPTVTKHAGVLNALSCCGVCNRVANRLSLNDCPGLPHRPEFVIQKFFRGRNRDFPSDVSESRISQQAQDWVNQVSPGVCLTEVFRFKDRY